MTISIGGVILPGTTVWSNRHLTGKVMQDRKLTLGARQIVTHAILPSGRPITLEGVSLGGTKGTGWITYLVFKQLQALEATPGITYVFDYNGETHNVIFMHDSPPALEGEPLVYRNNQADTDYFTYTLKLVTV